MIRKDLLYCEQNINNKEGNKQSADLGPSIKWSDCILIVLLCRGVESHSHLHKSMDDANKLSKIFEKREEMTFILKFAL